MSRERESFIRKFMCDFDLNHEDAMAAWRDAELLRENINMDNAVNFLHFINMSEKDKLLWRMQRAEKGAELRRDEGDRYVSLVRYVVETL